MPSAQELEDKFWQALKSDRTVMLRLESERGHSRPMTAQVDDDEHNIWFFGSNDSALVQALSQGDQGMMSFASKGHDIFACVEGSLSLNNDPVMIDKLWNPFIAAWYEGKTDPKLALLKFNPKHAEIWLNASSLVAGIKILLGADPKKEYKDNVAEVHFR